MALYSYAWAAGWDVALLDLTNVETDLLPYVGGQGLPIIPQTQPVNILPIRTNLKSGRVRGDGSITHEWFINVAPLAVLDYIIDTYLVDTGTELASAKMTISTRRHERAAYQHYNCWLELPQPGAHYRTDDDFVLDLRLVFHDLRAL